MQKTRSACMVLAGVETGTSTWRTTWNYQQAWRCTCLWPSVQGNALVLLSLCTRQPHGTTKAVRTVQTFMHIRTNKCILVCLMPPNGGKEPITATLTTSMDLAIRHFSEKGKVAENTYSMIPLVHSPKTCKMTRYIVSGWKEK